MNEESVENGDASSEKLTKSREDKNLKNSLESRSWSTARKPLPSNPKEADKLIQRRKRNAKATERSRTKLKRQANRGEQLENVRYCKHGK